MFSNSATSLVDKRNINMINSIFNRNKFNIIYNISKTRRKKILIRDNQITQMEKVFNL